MTGKLVAKALTISGVALTLVTCSAALPDLRTSVTVAAHSAVRVMSGDDAPGARFSDEVAGELADPRKVPCGGLWRYDYSGVPEGKTYYAREILCGGSPEYHALRTGDKVAIAGEVCQVTSTQDLNYKTGSVADIRWTGNVAVQTCYPFGQGKVKTIHFQCGRS